MIELTTARKNKIHLPDYHFQQDIESRHLLSDCSVFDLEVLEEILFSPLKISVKKLSRTLDCSEELFEPILQKLSDCALLKRQGDILLIDKERRKYFELQISRFKESFQPDLEFVQGLLKQIPIHILPTWYAIPRSSNNIFESIVEKYLLTPQIYLRYLMELNFSDPILNGIIQDVFSAHDFRIASSDLITKYNLTRSDFDAFMLQLEFHLICFVTYIREEDHWHEMVSPFHEWRQYQLFLQETQTPVIQKQESIIRHHSSDFAFIEEMTKLLAAMKEKPIEIANLAKDGITSKAVEKLLLIKLADRIDQRLYALETANDWLDLSLENRALYLFRHSNNHLLNDSLSGALCTERNIKEAANTIKRVLHGNWMYFDEFIHGAFAHLNENSVVMLKRNGKHWKYALPDYTEEEKALIKASIFEWLFECGMVATGILGDRDCFAVTPFGQFFFED